MNMRLLLLIYLLRRVVAANQVVNDIGMPDAGLDRSCISEIIFLGLNEHRSKPSGRKTYDKDNPAQITSNLQVTFGHFFTERYDDSTSLTC